MSLHTIKQHTSYTMSLFKFTPSDSHDDILDKRFRRLTHELTRTPRGFCPGVFAGQVT